MKNLLVLLSILFLVSCSSENPEAIKKQIISYKNKVDTYDKKINDLEAKLENDSLPKEDITGTAVIVKDMQVGKFEHHIQVSGKVEAVEEAFVSPEMSGQIKEIHVVEGQRVKKGQLLISLNTDVIEKSMIEVQTSLSLLVKLYEKQKELWDQNIGTEVQYLQAKTNKESADARLATLYEQLEMARIRAAFDGIVENIMAKEGELAMPGGRLVQLVNLEKLKINANVSEIYLNSIHKGDMVNVSFSATPGYEMNLPISRTGSVIDNLSRTFLVELLMNNKNEKIKPNQLAILRMNDFSSNEAFVLPSIIIKQDIKGSYVYRVEDNPSGPIATKVYIQPGLSSEDMTMIDSGVKPGMKIIIEGYNLVKNGSPVKVITE
ncbi:MAG: efflux RND transporter periplasmic adaptor subunit [Bacteroidales bacterium]|nr:efflux RND transporter periplasmic adaptor subunit [Bacteroidales bacterium]MCF8389619.1 efflux RND transporter periplasmic adaptor subunit [Bacteroidales bacterium]